MKIVIVGAGSVGYHLAKQLIDESKDVVLIEKDPARARYASNSLDCLVINDEGNDIEVLKKAGTSKADFFVCVTDSDEVNMITCALVHSEFNVRQIIARVRKLDYCSNGFIQKPFMGINFIVNPEEEAAKNIVNTVKYGAVSDVLLFESTNVQIRNIHVSGNSFFKDKTLKNIKEDINEDFLIAGILKNEEFVVPSGNSVIQENDTIFIVATKDNLERIFAKAGRPRLELHNIVIVGGGRVGNLVASYLAERNFNVTIVELDYNRCKILSEKLPGILIINSDIAEENIFKEENLVDYDLIITTTSNQELNILAAIYAKSLGIKRSVALAGKSNYLSMASTLGIDATVSPKNSAVESILKYIRKGNIRTIHSILNGKAEVIEYSIDPDSSVEGKSLKEIKMPDNSLVLTVSRNSKSYIPDGNFVINSGDTVITIAEKGSITRIEELFN
ncbi:MAG: Trk system potassium transporter TrkA [Oligoflexia bacterium]|nr:Trk system potassium transporter TrkA [Oligoflexia bacterium]